MSDALALVASIAAIAWACCAHPSRARCADGWWVEGVRPSGAYDCRPTPPPEPAVRGHEQDAPARRDPQIEGRIYCTGGARPIVYDYRTVGCQR